MVINLVITKNDWENILVMKYEYFYKVEYRLVGVTPQSAKGQTRLHDA